MLKNTNNQEYWSKIKEKKRGESLIFIHTPKCGGTYVRTILKTLGIADKGHVRATKKDGITFTVIRHPVERFESLLNYRLGGFDGYAANGDRFPRNLRRLYNNKSLSLNHVVAKMTKKQIMGFHPYRTLTYWSKDIDIFITIDELQEFLSFFGFTYNPEEFKKVKVSTKLRGKFNENTKSRISKLYSKDVALFKKVILFPKKTC